MSDDSAGTLGGAVLSGAAGFTPPVLLQEDQTPLHIASRLGKTEIVQLLLQHMAHPDAATTNGYTPLHISAREGQLETASVLLEAGASHSLATKVGGGTCRTFGALQGI